MIQSELVYFLVCDHCGRHSRAATTAYEAVRRSLNLVNPWAVGLLGDNTPASCPACHAIKHPAGRALSPEERSQRAANRCLRALELARLGSSCREIGRLIGHADDPSQAVSGTRAAQLVRRGERIERLRLSRQRVK